MANKLIQWNCRGLKANFNELLLLLTGLCPSIICLQETFLKPSDNFKVSGPFVETPCIFLCMQNINYAEISA